VKGAVPGRWLRPLAIPLALVEWWFSWVAYLLSNWAFLEVLEYAGTFSILVVVVLYFVERPDRIKQKHYQAWQVINTAQGKGGSGGRIEALEELNRDGVPLVGVDAQGAFLAGVQLDRAPLARANFSSSDLRGCHFRGADLNFGTLAGANFRGCDLENANLENAALSDADLTGADLGRARLAGATLTNADLTGCDLRGLDWQGIANIKNANVFNVQNAPDGFLAWAAAHGAVAQEPPSN
jgi:hypothetical protein